MPQVQISLRIPKMLKARLKAEATRRAQTMSALATSVLREGLTIYEDQEVTIRQKFEILLEPDDVERLEAQGFKVTEIYPRSHKGSPRLPAYAGPDLATENP